MASLHVLPANIRDSFAFENLRKLVLDNLSDARERTLSVLHNNIEVILNIYNWIKTLNTVTYLDDFA